MFGVLLTHQCFFVPPLLCFLACCLALLVQLGCHHTCMRLQSCDNACVVQLMEATQQVCSLQQQLSEQASLGTAHSIDMSRLQSKVEGLQTDIGSLTSSLQVKLRGTVATAADCL